MRYIQKMDFFCLYMFIYVNFNEAKERSSLLHMTFLVKPIHYERIMNVFKKKIQTT